MNYFRYLTFFSVLVFFYSCSQKVDPGRPNILFIPVDDLRPDLGCYGDSIAITPNIDKLAEEGVLFKRTYCQQSVCNPSRVSLLTGLRPDTLRVWDLRTEFRHTLPDVVTLPQYFKQNGYYTWGIGKIFHNIFPDTISWTEKPHIHSFPFDPDAVYLNPENLEKVEAKKQKYIEQGIDRVDQLGHWYIKTVATEKAYAADDAYFDGAQTTVAIEKMVELKDRDQPFFMAVGYYRPHLPFNAPSKYWDMHSREAIPLAENQYLTEKIPEYAINRGRELRGYEDFRDLPYPEDEPLSEERQRLLKHGYYASVSYIDAQIGRLIEGLKENGLYENTIIVIWGDHGWKLGEHNAWCKQTNFELDTRVPMIFAGPALHVKSAKSNALTEFVDIFPTLCDLAGLEIPAHLQGLSMLPLFKEPDLEWKTAAFSQFLQGRFGRMHKNHQGMEYMGYAMRTNRYRYIEWYEWYGDSETRGKLKDRELYDHHTDPDENKNIAEDPENKELVALLSEKMERGWRDAIAEYKK